MSAPTPPAFGEPIEDVEFVRSGVGPSPAMRQALEELRKKNVEDLQQKKPQDDLIRKAFTLINFHMALCYMRENPAKAIEPLNIVIVSEEKRKKSDFDATDACARIEDARLFGLSLYLLPSLQSAHAFRQLSSASDQPSIEASNAVYPFAMRGYHNNIFVIGAVNSQLFSLSSRAPITGKVNETILASAVKYLRASADANPSTLLPLNSLGLLTIEAGKFTEGAAIFKQVYDASGKNYLDGAVLSYALVNRGVCLMQLNLLEEAASCFQEVLSKDQQHLEALCNYSVILFKHRRFDDAVLLLEKCCGIYKSEPFVWLNLACVYAAVGLFQESHASLAKAYVAIKSVQTACAQMITRLDSRIETNAGSISFSFADFLHAHEHIMRVIETDPSDSTSWATMGKIFDAAAEQGDMGNEKLSTTADDSDDAILFSKAVQSITHALSLDPDNAYTWNSIGSIYLRRGYFKEAAKMLHAAVSREPDCPSFWCNLLLALHLEKLHRKSTSENDSTSGEFDLDAALSAAKEKFPAHPQILNSILVVDMASILRDIGRLDDALQVYTRVLDLCPSDPALWNNIGLVRVSQGQLQQATDCFNKALEADPASTAAQTNLEVIKKLQEFHVAS